VSRPFGPGPASRVPDRLARYLAAMIACGCAPSALAVLFDIRPEVVAEFALRVHTDSVARRRRRQLRQSQSSRTAKGSSQTITIPRAYDRSVSIEPHAGAADHRVAGDRGCQLAVGSSERTCEVRP
jgi:hypothetical protein